MSTPPFGGPWSVWDVQALRRPPRPAIAPWPPTAELDLSQWRNTPMSDEANGRAKAGQRAGEERLEVLRLLQAGEITAEEAAQLLDALDRSESGPRPTGRAGGPAAAHGSGHIRLRVSDSATGRANVNLSLPLGLIGAGVAVARRFAPDQVPDAAVLQEALAGGLRGKLLDVDGEGERVEIWVE